MFLSLSGENEVVFLDSCASKSICTVKDANVMERVDSIRSSIQTTRADVQLECVGEGSKFQHWTDVRVCPGSVKNIVSGGLLRAKGFGLMLLLEPKIVRLSDQSVVLKRRSMPGMACLCAVVGSAESAGFVDGGVHGTGVTF